MNLQQRLNQADHRTLERALCHIVALAAEQSAPTAELRGTVARSLLASILDVGEKDWCLPFDLDEASLSDHAIRSIYDRTYTSAPMSQEIGHRGV